MNIDLTHAEEVARLAAKDAAKIILEIYETAFKVDFKIGDDPVTEADRRASRLIVDRLAAAFPEVPIVSEEEAPDRAYETSEAAWFVDPLDGTRDFVQRNGDFCVMIGLALSGRAALGIIYVPVTGEELVGVVGRGGYVTPRGGPTRALACSKVSDPKNAEVLVSRSRSRAAEPFLQAFAPRLTRSVGSAGLKAVAIAKGEADVYVQPDRAGSLWDACAPEAIVMAAGGRASTIDGTPFDFRSCVLENTRGMVFANAALYEPALSALRGLAVD